MRRLYFKKEMAAAILRGEKTATTRTNPLPLDEPILAVRGSYYKQEPFAMIEIQDRRATTWSRVIDSFFASEGFASSLEMRRYLKKKNLMKAGEDEFLYFHQLKVLTTMKEKAER